MIEAMLVVALVLVVAVRAVFWLEERRAGRGEGLHALSSEE